MMKFKLKRKKHQIFRQLKEEQIGYEGNKYTHFILENGINVKSI